MTLKLREKCALIVLVLLCGFSVVADEGVVVNDDLFVGVWHPSARRWQKEVPICIWSENGDRFRIIATGLSPGQNFSVSNDLGNLVRYNVILRSGQRFRGRERLRQNTPSRRVYRSSATEQCVNGESARIQVVINKRQIDRAIPSVYSDTLLLVLSPQ